MELKEAIGRRRTIRFYLPFRPVERAKIQKMLEAARRASCAGNVMNVRAIVIWRDQASPELLKAITPGIGYQQMQTAPVFILWCSEASVYHGANWIESVLRLAENRRIGLEVESTQAEINTKLRPVFVRTGEQMGVAPMTFADVGQAIAQATLVAYEEGLGTCLMGGGTLAAAAKLMNLPATCHPVLLQSVGYPAESWEAGGQTPKTPFGEMFFEMSHGQSFVEDPAVEKELWDAKLIQEQAPLPWRDAELRYVAGALGLKDTLLND